ncbi:hypothetical protein BJY16_003567 [Actinoplanes octamycinicus]|uniref:Uncharacterized protein n=1 Tax=Actinoplanes octamycinicus TaxID=135948 RepID=A0A7W7GXH4_9ACTN|nr:hypothetical protein [Actinoplanes octamycinicus]MBB4740108.1 hypothetical protein [Actinoplanes octamycinicus]GIE59505.1 hypothetical protein Aoc01nite_49070 [Actinoplanes octamycinicus]
MTRREIAKQRAGDAYLVLRGRPARPSYGVLVVLPLIAAAGGAMIALGLESLVTRRRAPKPVAEVADAADRRLESVGA